MSEVEDKQINYEFSYNIDDINLKLNNQSEDGYENYRKDSLTNSEADINSVKHLTSVNKPYFPKRTWTKGRSTGVRLKNCEGDKAIHDFDADLRHGREERERDRSWTVELRSVGNKGNPRSRSKEPNSSGKKIKSSSKNFKTGNHSEERNFKNRNRRSSSVDNTYRRSKSSERVLKSKGDKLKVEYKESHSTRVGRDSGTRDNTSRDNFSRNSIIKDNQISSLKEPLKQPRRNWNSDQEQLVHLVEQKLCQSAFIHVENRSRSRERHIAGESSVHSRSKELKSKSKIIKDSGNRLYMNSEIKEQREERHSKNRTNKRSSSDKAFSRKSRRSRSNDKEPPSMEHRPKSGERISRISEHQTNNVGLSEPRDNRSKSRDRNRVTNRDTKRPKSRSVESRGNKGRDKRSANYNDRRSRSRGRRSNSREGHSRNRGMMRRSRSRERRSRSMERHYSSRERRSRSRSMKRSRRHSDSRSRSRSRSRNRRRRPRSYSRSKSTSPDVIAYTPKTELIDVDQYDKDRLLREIMDPRSNYGSSIISTYPGQQAPVATPSFHINQQFQVPPPPGIEPYQQSQPEHSYPPSQPPPAPYISNQTPPAPFISSQTPPGPPQLLGGPNPSAQQYTAPPPPILSQQPPPPGQFPHIPSGQTEEYSGYQQNLGNEFLPNSFAGFEGVPQQEHFQSTSSQSNSYSTLQNKDFGVNWKPPKPQSTSSIVIYPQSGPENSNSSNRSSNKKPGVEEEKQNQKQMLVLQREQYLQKNTSLQKELNRLKEQRSELLHDNSIDSERLLKENTKLQNEITQRLKAIENVVEIMSGLIKKVTPEEKGKKFSNSPDRKEYTSSLSPKSHHSQDTKKTYSDEMHLINDRMEKKEAHSSPKRSRSPRRLELRIKEENEKSAPHTSILQTSPPPLIFPKLNRERSPPKLKLPLKESKPDIMKALEVESALGRSSNSPNPVNLIHYDPELHWCSLCNVFPKTVVDYLNHLHSPTHKQQITVLKLDSSPWHADEIRDPSPPIVKNAPSKRIPIRGVQFLVPTTGWYCRLCKTWSGDLHCAQEHLKGRKHTTNYSDYTAQNPHWEVDWLSDRTKSFERSSENLSRLREKNESVDPTLNNDLESEKAKFSALSNTLLAVLAQQNKRQRQPSTSSSSSSSSSEEDRKKPKKSKKKKSKKKKKKDESPQANRNFDKSPHVPQYRQKNVDDEESSQKSDMISNWMEVDKSENSVKIKSKYKQGLDRSHDNRTDRSHDSRLDRHDGSRPERSQDGRPDRSHDSRSDIERHRDQEPPKGDKYREDRVKSDDKRDSREERFRDDRGPNRNWNRSRDQYNTRDQFNNRDSFVNKDQYSKRDSRDSRDFKSKHSREDPQAKKMEQQKKNLLTQRAEDQSMTDKSPLKVFLRPDDPLDRDSPEPVDKKDKTLKSDKPQGKLWFPSKETKEVEEEEEEPITPFEKQAEESVSKKKTEVKKVTQFSLPKTKLPFIGRMPILKKKIFDYKAEESLKDEKSEKSSTWPSVPDTRESSDQEPRKSKWDVKTPPSSKTKEETKTIYKEPSPELDNISNKTNDDNLGEQDMDITNDDQDNITWVDEGQKGDLHQDFQDALDLLFPEGDIRNDVKDKGSTLPTPIEITRQSCISNTAFSTGGSVEIPGHQPIIPSLGPECGLMINLNVPPPIVPGGSSIINDGSLLMTTMGPPPIIPGEPPLMSQGGPPPLGPTMLGQLPMGNELLTRPPPPIPSGGPNLRQPMLGPGSHLPLGSMMGPRHMATMGPPVRLMDGQIMGPGGMNMAMTPSQYSPEDEAEDEPAPKRKNAPSQRMRRYIQKKKAEAQAKINPSTTIEQKRSKYEGMDESDLAMLGIDEDDSIIT